MRNVVRMLITVGLLVACVSFVAAEGLPLQERVWSNHAEYMIIEVGNPPSPAEGPAMPYYIIGAVDEAHPQGPEHEGALGPHDHVIPAVPLAQAEGYTPLWRITLVVPGPNAVLFGPEANVLARFVTPPDPPVGPLPLVYAAVLPGMGTIPHPLQSAEEVQQAAALGLVTLVDTGIVFTGPVVQSGHGY